MNNPERVFQFLMDHRTDGYCDDCIEKETGVDRHEVNTIANTLGLFGDVFTRSKAVCPQHCGDREKWVTFSF